MEQDTSCLRQNRKPAIVLKFWFVIQFQLTWVLKFPVIEIKVATNYRQNVIRNGKLSFAYCLFCFFHLLEKMRHENVFLKSHTSNILYMPVCTCEISEKNVKLFARNDLMCGIDACAKITNVNRRERRGLVHFYLLQKRMKQ